MVFKIQNDSFKDTVGIKLRQTVNNTMENSGEKTNSPLRKLVSKMTSLIVDSKSENTSKVPWQFYAL